MKKHTTNPWKWQDSLGYAQAVEIQNSNGTLYCSGQAAVDPDGKPVPGTMEQQIKLTLENLSKVIHQAGYQVCNIVRLNLYTTSIPEFFQAYGTLIIWMKNNHLTPTSTLVEVKALAFPELKVEFEATVVR